MVSRLAGWMLLVVLLGQTFASPLSYHDGENRPLAVVTDIGQRLASHSHLPDPSVSEHLSRSRQDPSADQRLGLPSPQELEAIKKVAQILIMLGEQVIPGIIGEPAPHAPACGPVEEVPNDDLTADN